MLKAAAKSRTFNFNTCSFGLFGRCDIFHVEVCLKSSSLQIFVWGSNVILDNYKKGNLSPTKKDKIY